jgi:hypothetical protein
LFISSSLYYILSSSKSQLVHLNHIMSIISPRFLCRPTAFFFDLLEQWYVRELYIRKTADLSMQLCLGTFPRFVAIGFYFLSETLI